MNPDGRVSLDKLRKEFTTGGFTFAEELRIAVAIHIRT